MASCCISGVWGKAEGMLVYLFSTAIGWLNSLSTKGEHVGEKEEVFHRKQNTPRASNISHTTSFYKNKSYTIRVTSGWCFLRTNRSVDAFFITLQQVAKRKKSFRECITITNLKCFVSQWFWQKRERFCISNAEHRAQLLWHTNSAFDM